MRAQLCLRLYRVLLLVALGVPYSSRTFGLATHTDRGRSARLDDRNFQFVKTNGIRLRAVVEGKGPLVILLHGFPYGWYLWHHQIDPIVNAGFQVAVPDLRGYGESDRPEAIEAYNIIEATKDIVGLADALGHKQFIVVGQDWGAVTAWYTALVHRNRTRAVVGMTYPFFRPDWFHIATALPRQENFAGRFAHYFYFQKPGVAEAEFEADVRKSLLVMYYHSSGDAPGQSCFAVRSPAPDSGKFFDGFPSPDHLPSWLSEEELDYASAQWRKSGFRGSLNWYRNFDLNADLTRSLQDVTLAQPALFIAGEKEVSKQSPVLKRMGQWLTGLRGTVIIEGAGHSVPMEAPTEVNKALLGFLETVR